MCTKTLCLIALALHISVLLTVTIYRNSKMHFQPQRKSIHPYFCMLLLRKARDIYLQKKIRALSMELANSILIRANLYLLIKDFLLNLVTHFVNLRKKIKKSVLLPPQWQMAQDLRNFLSIIKKDFLMSELRKNTP